MLPVIDATAVHLARVPTAPHQPRRVLAVRPTAALTPMPRHPHGLAAAEAPRVPRIAPPLARQRGAAVRAAAPLPPRPPRERAEPLHKGPTPVYDVHGLAHREVARNSLWWLSPLPFRHAAG